MKMRTIAIGLLLLAASAVQLPAAETNASAPSAARRSATFPDEELCELLARAAQEESREMGIGVSFAVADESGDLLFFKRMDDALPVSVMLVPKKAWTAAKLRTATGNLTREVAPDGSLFGIHSSDARFVVIAGGFPLFRDGRCVGAIGVDGGTAEQDDAIGRRVLRVYEKILDERKDAAHGN